MIRLPIIVACVICFVTHAFGWQCDLKITGEVRDLSTGIALSSANIYVEEIAQGAVTDQNGRFQLDMLCPGAYHLRVSHIGCHTSHLFIQLHVDTAVLIRLEHHSELLDEVHVHGVQGEHTLQHNQTLSRDRITSGGDRTLAAIASEIAGVRMLQNGSGIGKPVIHGLTGNRITLLNNGVVQAGQEWGNDHAPEIDPFGADHIAVVKGAAALAHGGNALGGVIMIEPGAISTDPHLHGEVMYGFATNGRGHVLSTSMERGGLRNAFRLTGSIKRSGDLRAPGYFLNNTGRFEHSTALQYEHKSSESLLFRSFYSLYHTSPGILRGSHISNLTDLELAIGRDQPFFTEEKFSYAIGAPQQDVWHHLLKFEMQHTLNKDAIVKVHYAGQFNRRQEFDIRRSGRTDIAALSLDLQNHTLEGVLQSKLGEWGLKSGAQLTLEDNTNNPATGVLPLIPDYRLFNGGAFAIINRESDLIGIEMGVRYDLRWLEVLRITRTTPPSVERLQHLFHNISTAAGIQWTPFQALVFNLQTGVARRAPEPNELYSSGLHQGVSGIEEGDPDLEPELSFKTSLGVKWHIDDALFIEAIGYIQPISNYIFLQPQDSFRLTIRGAFPVFKYTQTNARLTGLDCNVLYEPVSSFRLSMQYAIVRGSDRTNSQPLILIPPDDMRLSMQWFLPSRRDDRPFWLRIGTNHTWRQTRFPVDQELLIPPSAYTLVSAGFGTDIHWHDSRLRLSVTAENLFDRKYRDYLNRLRYFADAPGRDLRLNVRYIF